MKLIIKVVGGLILHTNYWTTPEAKNLGLLQVSVLQDRWILLVPPTAAFDFSRVRAAHTVRIAQQAKDHWRIIFDESKKPAADAYQVDLRSWQFTPSHLQLGQRGLLMVYTRNGLIGSYPGETQ